MVIRLPWNITPADSICRSSTIGHTVRSAHSDGLFRYWEMGSAVAQADEPHLLNPITKTTPK